jgi:para-aminobenzoate synthetase component 1
VVADELFGIYTFPQVHQMISTVRGQLRPGIGFTEILQASFPMGSMTGAPKKKVMELIDRYEAGRRGLYSGALGYIDPSGDFDFNVVIRSILYNQSTAYLSFPAGSAITHHSDPGQEYEECLLKAAAMRMALK